MALWDFSGFLGDFGASRGDLKAFLVIRPAGSTRLAVVGKGVR